MPGTCDFIVMSIANIEQRLHAVPDSPGIYIMKDAQDNVLYVGKANVLKNRVRSYFQASANHQPKTIRMVARIEDFEFVVTNTCLLYTSPSPRDLSTSRMPSSA